MARADELRTLLDRVRAATGPDRELSIDLMTILWPERYRKGVSSRDDSPYGVWDIYLIEYRPETKYNDAGWYGMGTAHDPDPTASIDAAVALVERVLPGWAWSCGSCHVSNDGWLKPDTQGPAAHLCDIYDDGFDGSTKGGNVPLSILDALLQALIAQAEAAPATPGAATRDDGGRDA